MLIQIKVIILYLLLTISHLAHAEVFRWVDTQGRVQFSDVPNTKSANIKAASQALKAKTDAVDHKKISNKEPKDLKAIAHKMKKERLAREKAKKKRDKNRQVKLKKHQKQLAAAKKKKLACKKAKEKEDLAFRKRTQQQGLLKMRKALANYEKKREARRKKCSR
jgi:hypothetical protein